MEQLLLSPSIYEKRWNPLTDEILSDLAWRSLREILRIIAEKAIELTPQITELIRKKMDEGIYAFVPSKEEAKLLIQMRFDSAYQHIIHLVPHYKNVDLIRSGLLIGYYHENDTPANRERVGKIKSSIIKRPNGRKLLKIANMASTPYFSAVGYLLQQRKNEGYNEENIEELLDSIVEQWEVNAKLVEIEDKIENIYDFCILRFEQKIDTFFICGMKTTASKVESVLKRIQEEGLLTIYNYNAFNLTSFQGNTPRTQIIFQKELIN